MYFYFFLGEVGFQEFVEHELTFVFLITNVIATVFFLLILSALSALFLNCIGCTSQEYVAFSG